MEIEVNQVTEQGTTFNKSDNQLMWRLVHDGQKVLDLFQSVGYTQTQSQLFTATTEQECLNKITELGLAYNP